MDKINLARTFLNQREDIEWEGYYEFLNQVLDRHGSEIVCCKCGLVAVENIAREGSMCGNWYYACPKSKNLQRRGLGCGYSGWKKRRIMPDIHSISYRDADPTTNFLMLRELYQKIDRLETWTKTASFTVAPRTGGGIPHAPPPPPPPPPSSLSLQTNGKRSATSVPAPPAQPSVQDQMIQEMKAVLKRRASGEPVLKKRKID